MLSEKHPIIRRVIRFIALPYCYLKIVNWKQCKKSKKKVLQDILYIFFKLKYFPDNYSLCRLWDKERSVLKYYYGSIYDAYQRGRLRREVHKKEYGILYQDKSICYSLCKGNDIPVPKQFGVVDIDEDYKSFIKGIIKNNKINKLIIKPVNGGGGKDILLIEKKEKGIYVKEKETKIKIDKMKLKHRSVVQEFISQHEDLSKVSESINTVRIVTLLKRNGDAIIIGALMRFGVGNSFLDNTSQGGVAIGINLSSGYLKRTGYDFDCGRHLLHPTTLVEFRKFQIPKWKEVKELAKSIQTKIPYCRLLGQDIAITENGPILIEINDEYDNVGLEQAIGPILVKKEIWKEFKKYGLLINGLQKKIDHSKIDYNKIKQD